MLQVLHDLVVDGRLRLRLLELHVVVSHIGLRATPAPISTAHCQVVRRRSAADTAVWLMRSSGCTALRLLLLETRFR